MGNMHSRRRSPCGAMNSKSQIDPNYRQQEELKKEVEWFQRMQQDRREGRALLEKRIIKSDDTDWNAVLDEADSLEEKERKRKQQKERRWRRKQQRKRKRFDAKGSFSINLLTMKQSQDTECCPTTAVPGTFDASIQGMGKLSGNSFNKTNRSAVQRWKQTVVPVLRHRSDATEQSMIDDDFLGSGEENLITVIHSPVSTSDTQMTFV